uniref:CSON009443 protein n=1 Tax=Culicoides sonorensis TaxID=179676 RepID=A0A336KFS6_CULSO
MVGSHGTILTMRLLRSKLRKREDSSAGSPVHVESPQAVLPNESTPPVTYRQQPPSNWVFPPLPPQPNLYIHNAANHDALIQSDKKGLYGFKKQLSGRFKRLVSRKHHESTPVIPPELKPQLKTIYFVSQ